MWLAACGMKDALRTIIDRARGSVPRLWSHACGLASEGGCERVPLDIYTLAFAL